MEFLNKCVETLIKEKERWERKAREKAKSMSDRQIISALKNSEERPGWAIEILEAEARRRHLRY